MKKRISRHQQMQKNPIALALMAQHHHDILTNTRIADQLALQAVEAGTASAADITRLDYLAAMLLSLARAGFGFAGITTAELQALCRAALAALDAGNSAPGAELNHCAPARYGDALTRCTRRNWTPAARPNTCARAAACWRDATKTPTHRIRPGAPWADRLCEVLPRAGRGTERALCAA